VRVSWIAALLLVTGGCSRDGKHGSGPFTLAHSRGQLDELPTLINPELPFRYPAALYARRVQGNVTLRLFIDRAGWVRPESTRVEEPSGYAALDSAAVAASRALQFSPAKRDGAPVAVSVLFPVLFRHPEAGALPGDSILQKTANGRRITP